MDIKVPGFFPAPLLLFDSQINNTMTRRTNAFLSGITAGIVIGILFAPMEGRKLRELLFRGRNEDDLWDERETYSINELVSEGSTSFDALKEKIKNGS